MGGEKITRPFGPTFHGTSSNDLLQFYYIDIGLGKDGQKYVLMLRDDHSDYKRVFFLVLIPLSRQQRLISSIGVPTFASLLL